MFVSRALLAFFLVASSLAAPAPEAGSEERERIARGEADNLSARNVQWEQVARGEGLELDGRGGCSQLTERDDRSKLTERDIQELSTRALCPGSWVDGGMVGSHGRWGLYYSSANGGTNCLIQDNTAGKSIYMGVSIWKQGDASPKYDIGNYQSYAGPVSVTGTASKCVKIYAFNDAAEVGWSRWAHGPGCAKTCF